MSGPLAILLAEGRLHLQHGPIDIVVEAVGSRVSPPPLEEGDQAKPGGGGSRPRRSSAEPPPPPFGRSPSPCGGGDARDAYRAAAARFATILPELCAELPELRRPAHPDRTSLHGAVARRMWTAVAPFATEAFVTPMAAVAGAVAEEVLAALVAAVPLARASVNNGGDIALHLGAGERMRVGLVDRPDRPSLFGATELRAEDGVQGVATSGWRGRSFSLGIADAVTVLARTAAEADAAATIIANAVDLPGHPAVERVPARKVQCDSDLGDLLVTRKVGALSAGEIAEALEPGLAKAEALVGRRLIAGAALHLQGETVTTTTSAIHLRRHAEEAGAAGRLKARATVGACFETAPGRARGLLSMTPEVGSRSLSAAA